MHILQDLRPILSILLYINNKYSKILIGLLSLTRCIRYVTKKWFIIHIIRVLCVFNDLYYYYDPPYEGKEKLTGSKLATGSSQLQLGQGSSDKKQRRVIIGKADEWWSPPEATRSMASRLTAIASVIFTTSIMATPIIITASVMTSLVVVMMTFWLVAQYVLIHYSLTNRFKYNFHRINCLIYALPCKSKLPLKLYYTTDLYYLVFPYVLLVEMAVNIISKIVNWQVMSRGDVVYSGVRQSFTKKWTRFIQRLVYWTMEIRILKPKQMSIISELLNLIWKFCQNFRPKFQYSPITSDWMIMKLQLINTVTFGPLFVENCFPNPVSKIYLKLFLHFFSPFQIWNEVTFSSWSSNRKQPGQDLSLILKSGPVPFVVIP